MKIIVNNSFIGKKMPPLMDTWFYSADQERTPNKNLLMSEHSIDVYINGTKEASLSCTPEHLPEFVAGWILTGQFVESGKDIKEINICEDGSRAEVVLLKDLESRPDHLEEVPSLSWESKQIYRYANYFESDNSFHQSVRSTHSAYLFQGDECLFRAKDLGRHSAMDKVIGYALLNQINLSSCVVYTSGRMPMDMVKKIIVSKIPVMISKKSPTKEATELARQYKLTLIGKATPDSFILYSE